MNSRKLDQEAERLSRRSSVDKNEAEVKDQEEGASTSSVLRRLYNGYLTQDKADFGVGLTSLLVSNVFNSSFIAGMRKGLNYISKDKGVDGDSKEFGGAFAALKLSGFQWKLPSSRAEVRSLVSNNWKELLLLLGFIGFAGVGILAAKLRTEKLAAIESKITQKLKKQVFSAALKQDNQYYDSEKKSKASMLTILRDDCRAAGALFPKNICQLIRFGISALINAIALCYSHLKLTAVTFLAIAPISSIVHYVGHRLRGKALRKLRNDEISADSRANQRLEYLTTVRMFGAEEYEAEKYEEISNLVEKDSVNLAQIQGDIRAGETAVVAFGISGSLAYLARTSVGLQIGDVIGFMWNSAMLSLALVGSLSAYSELKTSVQSAKRIFNLLDRTQQSIERDKISLTDLNTTSNGYEISFERVSFSYPSRPHVKVLRNISFKANPGEVLVITGISGSGKSTIAALLMKLYHELESGLIAINGQDISKLSTKQVRDLIGVVDQEPRVFHDSLLENIRYGNREASDSDVFKAAKLARADEFIMRLSDGYHTIVGDNGAQLSGGEKKRIAIARTLLKDPSIIIFDEATASLDQKNELAIRDVILDLVNESKQRNVSKTVIIIAHKKWALDLADQIVWMMDGRVLAFGTYAEIKSNTAKSKSTSDAIVASSLLSSIEAMYSAAK